jgi:4-amino-4-deoxy-L-arabinose transferase-like glycosyltransferase
MNKIAGKIEIWIFVFFVIRLIGVTNPPLETGHSWRQVTGLMVARNFFETDANIFYPRIDDNNGSSGVIGMEFPFLNYLHCLLAMIFGYEHWYGRLINLIVSSTGILFFYKLIHRVFSPKIAFASAICLIGSIWFAFSRKMMPDTFCISLMFTGLYFGIKYLDKQKFYFLILYCVFTSLAILSKIPAVIYFVITAIMLMNIKDVVFRRKVYLVLSTVFSLFLAYYWYFIWNPHLSSEFGNWYNTGGNFITGAKEIVSNIGLTFKNFFFYSFYSYLFFFSFIAGFILMFVYRQTRLILVFFSVFLVFII